MPKGKSVSGHPKHPIVVVGRSSKATSHERLPGLAVTSEGHSQLLKDIYLNLEL
jgi:hypothetical protein